MKLSRRKLAKSVIGAALATTATQELAAQSPANAEESSGANQSPNEGSNASPNASPNTDNAADLDLQAALLEQRADRQAMDAIEMPMTTQPAVHFKPRT